MTEFQTCVRCGRKLKTSEARERGMGKVCYKKFCTDMNRYTEDNIHNMEFKKFRLFEVDSGKNK